MKAVWNSKHVYETAPNDCFCGKVVTAKFINSILVATSDAPTHVIYKFEKIGGGFIYRAEHGGFYPNYLAIRDVINAATQPRKGA